MNPLFSFFLPPQSNLLTLLNAVLVTGTGASNILKFLCTKMTWEVVITGAPVTAETRLEGSIDNTNWYSLDTSTTITSEMRHVVNKPVLFIRGNLISFTGGTTPTFTVRFVGGGN